LLAPRKGVGDANHQPAAGKNLQPARARGGEQPLRDPERHHEQARAPLETVKPGYERVCLVGRLGAGERLPAEVDEVAAQAALHHPVRRDRGVDPAREQHHRAPAGADRKTARSSQMVDRDEQLAGVRVDAKLDVRVGQIDAVPELVVDGSADLSSDVHRADREALLAPPRADRERARRQLA
jgi:hypothetical protein